MRARGNLEYSKKTIYLDIRHKIKGATMKKIRRITERNNINIINYCDVMSDTHEQLEEQARGR